MAGEALAVGRHAPDAIAAEAPRVAAGLPQLEVLSAGFPRAFSYRKCEVLANAWSYDRWQRTFSRLGGIAGKVLQEERTDIVTARNLQYFQRYKREHPTKVVLEHLNGWARRPSFETVGWWPGFWLYAAGCRLSAPVGTVATRISVTDPSLFHLKGGRQVNNDDMIITELGADGRPDFATAEQVSLTGVDPAARTITVTRGQYGSRARAFPAGAYIAPHVSAPYATVDDVLWLYNLSTHAPKDPRGRTVIDALRTQFARKFEPGGELASFDGLVLDVLTFDPPRPQADCDCDGVADGGIFGGIQTFGLGAMKMEAMLREVLGPNRILVVDGGKSHRPATASVNGVEREGFPSISDRQAATWSESVTMLSFYERNAASPAFDYPLYKWSELLVGLPVSFPLFRLACAAAQLLGTQFSFWDEPTGAPMTDPSYTIWDELVAGTLHRPNWLGAPISPVIHLAGRGPDVLHGAGMKLPPTFVRKLSGAGATVRRSTVAGMPQVTVASGDSSTDLAFALTGVTSAGPDLVLSLEISAEPLPGYPVTTGRNVAIGAGPVSTATPWGTITVPATAAWFPVTLYFRGISAARGTTTSKLTISFVAEGGLGVSLRRMRAFAAPDTTCRRFAGGAVFANPSTGSVTFPIADLFPGASFRRLTATKGQDAAVNNGQAVGDTLELGPVDALFVIDA